MDKEAATMRLIELMIDSNKTNERLLTHYIKELVSLRGKVWDLQDKQKKKK